jgi:hypothetical protein
MPTTLRLSFDVSATGPDLRLIVSLDQVVVWDGYPGSDPVMVEHLFDDNVEGDHVLTFDMRGKRPEHTKIDSAGMIIQDRCISITNIAFDDIRLGHTVTSVSHYHHNNNDTTEPVSETFYDVMGCNGRVEMRFSTPIYLWLLENM